jgi:serine/threonine-protein kinase RsbW
MEAAEAWLDEHEVPAKAAYFVALAIEEIVTNCIHYGYDDEEDHTIVVSLAVADETLTVGIVDDGRAFDPLAAPEPDFSEKIQNRRVGGLGIHLLRNLADRISYERLDGTNRMILEKKLE